jgi:hypothetical protein
MVAVACPMATAVQVRPSASLAASAPNPGGQLLCLGECLGVIGG